MKAQVKSYIFRKVGNHWEYIKDSTVYSVTNEMLQCLRYQYKLMGYMNIIDCAECVSFSKVLNEIEIFSEKLSGKA